MKGGEKQTTNNFLYFPMFFTGKVCLTFFGQWSEVQTEISSTAMEQMYCAPGKTIAWLFPGSYLPPSGKI